MGNCASARWMDFIGSVQRAVREVLPKVLETAGAQGLLKEHHKGGYFCLKMFGADRFLIKPMLVGEVVNGRDDDYIRFCQEKALRLEAQHEPFGHVSSWESRDPHNDQYGGAILGPDCQNRNYAFSFSGLPERCDEVVNLLTAVKVGHLTPEAAIAIAEISGSDNLLVECGFFDGKILEDDGDR